MAVKKANGEGSINKYKNGWRATITIGRNSDGKLIRKQFYGKTKKDALDKMNEYKINSSRGLILIDEKINLEDWVNTWLNDFKAIELKPSSLERYLGVYNKYIKHSSIAKIKIKDLKAPNLQQYYNELLKNGKSENVIRTINKVLKAALTTARKNNYIYFNPCDNVILPKVKYTDKEKISVFTMEEERKLLSYINGNKYEMLLVLDLATGLRVGELVALKWKDIDFEKGILKVSKSMTRKYVEMDGKRKLKIEEDTPKTKSSIRSVPIPSNVLCKLKKYKEEQEEFKKEYNDIYNDRDYVFANKLGEFIKPDTITKAYCKILREAGISHKKFHSLRHTYATRLSEIGVPLNVIQKLLGHSSIRMTADIYTHVMDEEKVIAVERINELFVESV